MHGYRVTLMGSLLAMFGCDLIDGEPSSQGEPAVPAAKDPNDTATPDTPTPKDAPGGQDPGASPASDIALGELQRRPGSSPLDVTGQPTKAPIRGPIAWRPPKHWTPRRDAGKPFILGEYGLDGHTDERPALCRLVHNTGYSTTKTDEEQAISEAKRTRLRDDAGKSLLSKLEPKREKIGALEWYVVFAEGRYRAPGSFGKVAPEEMLPGYAQMNLIPAIKDTRVSLRCWAPAETMKAQEQAMRAWAASVQYPADAGE